MKIFGQRGLDAEQNYIRMTEQPVKDLVLQLATPTIITMLITSFYNMTDTIFVSRLGTQSSAAVGVVYSVMSIIKAIGLTLGQGSANTVSRLLGEKRRDEANQLFSTAFFTSMAIAVIFAVVGLLYTDRLVRLLGATDTIAPHAVDYASIILIGAPWMAVSYTMNNNLRSEGKAYLGMIGMSTGAVLNVILDPILIFGLNMGIKGAAVATVFSQLVAFLILLSHFVTERSNLTLSIRQVRLKWRVYRSIIVIGTPSLIRTLMHTVATVTMNVLAAPFGDVAIAAMSITMRVMQFLNSALIGFGQGMQPVAGFSWGAKRYDRLKEAFYFCRRTAGVAFIFIAALCFVFARTIMLLFLKDPVVVAIGTTAIRAQCVLLPITVYSTLGGMVFQSTGHGRISSLLALVRQGLFFIPTVIVLSKTLGLFGVQIAQPVADLATFLLTMVFVIPFERRLDRLAAVR